jgi:hypothetical protein
MSGKMYVTPDGEACPDIDVDENCDLNGSKCPGKGKCPEYGQKFDAEKLRSDPKGFASIADGAPDGLGWHKDPGAKSYPEEEQEQDRIEFVSKLAADRPELLRDFARFKACCGGWLWSFLPDEDGKWRALFEKAGGIRRP